MHGIHLVADLGFDHGGRLARARRLMEVAAAAGANSVLVSVTTPQSLLLPNEADGSANPDFDVLANSMVSDKLLVALRELAESLGLELGVRIYDSETARRAVDAGAAYLRLSSADLIHDRLLREASQTGARLVLGAAMADLAEIEHALGVLWREGARDLLLLHGVALSGDQWERLNLAFLPVLQRIAGMPTGFTDTFDGEQVAPLAIGAGAVWIERGLCLADDAPVAPASLAVAGRLSPDSFARYGANLRRFDAAMRWRWPKVGQAEHDARRRLRRGLYAARSIETGERIGLSDIVIARPAAVMSPKDLEELLGCVTRGPISRFTPFSPELLLHPWAPRRH